MTPRGDPPPRGGALRRGPPLVNILTTSPFPSPDGLVGDALQPTRPAWFAPCLPGGVRSTSRFDGANCGPLRPTAKSGSGRLSRLFDQLHEARLVVGEATHVTRGGELDSRRSRALGHE